MLKLVKLILGSVLLCSPLFLGGCGDKSKMSDAMHPSMPGVKVKAGSYKDFKMRFAHEDRVYFDYDNFSLQAVDKKILTTMTDWFKNHKQVHITVCGHCDSRGSASYNLALGQRRAVRVKDYLVSKGIAMGRIKVVSFGKENQPMPNAMDEMAHAENRVAIIKVSKCK